jgi:hypothetical protein
MTVSPAAGPIAVLTPVTAAVVSSSLVTDTRSEAPFKSASNGVRQPSSMHIARGVISITVEGASGGGPTHAPAVPCSRI